MTAKEEAAIRESQRNPPVDITALANDLGLPVYETEDLPVGVSGKIEVDEDGAGSSGFKIFINAADPYTRQRFTVAHEIAHYLLHRDKIGSGLSDNGMYRSENVTSQEEFAANNKAAELLMPRSLVLKYLDQGSSTYSGMARMFDVSIPAMKARLKYLLHL